GVVLQGARAAVHGRAAEPGTDARGDRRLLRVQDAPAAERRGVPEEVSGGVLGLQRGAERLERAGAMREGVLLVIAHLRERPLVAVGDEDRVPAEAVLAARGEGDPPRAVAARH